MGDRFCTHFPGAAKKADNVRREQAREQAREKERQSQRARAEKEMQEDFHVHSEKNLAAQKAQQQIWQPRKKTQQQQQKEKKKQQTPTRVSARIRGEKVPEIPSLGSNQGRESTRDSEASSQRGRRRVDDKA
jgi:hypothetical protein